jgi:predicted nucleic acid-binding protein
LKYLLDVSTLVALLWRTHPDNPKVSAWRAGKDLVLCPLTELGFLRVVTSPAFNASMAQARLVLQNFLTTDVPDFISADLRALSGRPAPSSSKTTDWYLANLADAHGMRWATLDGRANHPSAELVT